MQLLINPVLALPRAWKRVVAVFVDSAICALTVWIAYYLRLGEWVPMNGRPMVAIGLAVGLAIPVFAAFGVYRLVFRHVGMDVIATCAAACLAYGLGYSALVTAYGFDQIPRTVGIIQPALLFIVICVARVVASFLLSPRRRALARKAATAHALIYGAGFTGRQLAQAMATSREMKIAGFIDDDVSLHNSRIAGLRVLGSRDLARHIAALEITDVLLAMPSANRSRRTQIIEELKQLGVRVRMLPGLMDLAHGTMQTSDLREVTITDLLQREPVPYDSGALRQHVTGNVILVTGAGGSIGSELCRQLIVMNPAKLLLVESSEYALYNINNELETFNGAGVVPLLASVTDSARMDAIMRTWKPHMVVHAAAYKHVPLVEHNPLEGLRNNVIGTSVAARSAARHGVRDFILVSTDKAVRPTNVMGASKRLAELILQGLSTTVEAEDTCFSMVRFGNVLGSSGSVVPLFTRQIQEGGPITITHADITRYFMTIPEAVHLVLQAGAMARGGEVFVLDMGEPVRIADLARNMVHLSGLTVRSEAKPDGDIEIREVGLRPGEKLYEELLIGGNPMPTSHPRIMKARESSLPWGSLSAQIDRLNGAISGGEVVDALALLRELVPEFAPTSDVVDWVELAYCNRESALHELRFN